MVEMRRDFGKSMLFEIGRLFQSMEWRKEVFNSAGRVVWLGGDCALGIGGIERGVIMD